MSRLPDNDRTRPAANGTGSGATDGHTNETSVAVATDRPRCQNCGHPVFSAESIQIGIGRDCRRALAVVA